MFKSHTKQDSRVDSTAPPCTMSFSLLSLFVICSLYLVFCHLLVMPPVVGKLVILPLAMKFHFICVKERVDCTHEAWTLINANSPLFFNFYKNRHSIFQKEKFQDSHSLVFKPLKTDKYFVCIENLKECEYLC